MKPGKRILFTAFISGLCGLMAIAWSGCGQTKKLPMNPVTEAYLLMDKGENAQAVLILEKAWIDWQYGGGHSTQLGSSGTSGNEELRLALGSAYAGLAGIDIITMRNAFQDIAFSQSIFDQIRGEESSSSDDANQTIERELMTLQKALLIFSRFPKVTEPRQRGYLVRALEVLKTLGIDEDARTFSAYRIFLTVNYLKADLEALVIQPSSKSLHAWLCALDAAPVLAELSRLNQYVDQSVKDFATLFPDKASPLELLRGRLTGLAAGFQKLGADPAASHAALGCK